MFEGSFCTMEIHYVYQVKCGICQNWVPSLSKEAVIREDKGLKEPGLSGQPGINQQSTKPPMFSTSDIRLHRKQVGPSFTAGRCLSGRFSSPLQR